MAFAPCWLIAFLVLLAAATRRLYHLRRRRPTPEWDILLYLILAPVIAAVGYYLFLHLLNYLTRPWYFLALLSILAVSLVGLAASLLSLKWIRFARLLFVLAASAILPFYAWPKIIERQSNIDIVAKKVTELAKPVDLIIVAPWQYGISFNRYYKGAAPWITLPKIADLRAHRYDLFREKMVSAHPIDDVLEKSNEHSRPEIGFGLSADLSSCTKIGLHASYRRRQIRPLVGITWPTANRG